MCIIDVLVCRHVVVLIESRRIEDIWIEKAALGIGFHSRSELLLHVQRRHVYQHHGASSLTPLHVILCEPVT